MDNDTLLNICLGVIAILGTGYGIYQNWRRNRLEEERRPVKNLTLIRNVIERISLNKLAPHYFLGSDSEDSKRYNNLAYCECAIGNDGNVVLERDDFIGRISIEFTGCVEIISLDLLATTSSDLTARVEHLKAECDKINLSFETLNIGEAVQFKVVYSEKELEESSEFARPELRAKLKDSTALQQVQSLSPEEYKRQKFSNVGYYKFETKVGALFGAFFSLFVLVAFYVVFMLVEDQSTLQIMGIILASAVTFLIVVFIAVQIMSKIESYYKQKALGGRSEKEIEKFGPFQF